MVFDLVRKHFGINNSRAYWLGVTDREIEGYFTYLSSGEPLAFYNWGIGEPNDGGGPNGGAEDCMNFLVRAYKGGKWNDFYCSKETQFICQAFL